MQLLSVTVRTRQNLLFHGEARAVSSYNEKGLFDILPRHANFITLINRLLILHLEGGKTQELHFSRGILEVGGDNVFVYLGIAAADTPGFAQTKK